MRSGSLWSLTSADIRPVNSFDLTPVRMVIVRVEKWKITKGFVVSTCCYL